MLNLIIAESEIELVPARISQHPSIRKMAEKKMKDATELLLDSNFHHSAMAGLFDEGRRGRPDLVHHVLITSMDSPLNHEGLLRIFIHTRKGRVIKVNPRMMVPQSYNRFVGLVEQLFRDKKVPASGEPLMELEKHGFSGLLKGIGPDFTVLLSEKGEKMPPEELGALLAKYKNPVAVIGGFPHGEFTNEIEDAADLKVCIDPDCLKAWTAASRVIMGYEVAIGLAKKRLGL